MLKNLLRLLLVPALAGFFITPAQAALDLGDIICETTTTTGTGTVNLAGAVSNYATFVSQIATGAQTAYHISASDGKLETGYGTFTDASPDTLTRVANWSSDGSGAELTLPAGTHTVCVGPIAPLFNNGLGLSTPGTSLAFVLDSDGTPATAFTLGTTHNSLPSNTVSTGTGVSGVFVHKSDTDDALGPSIITYKNTASPADNDVGGYFAIATNNDAAQIWDPLLITATALDVTDNTEDSRVDIARMSAGSFLTSLSLGATDPTGIVGDQFTLPPGSDTFPSLFISQVDNDGGGPTYSTFKSTTTPAASDYVGGFAGFSKDSGGTDVEQYGGLQFFIADPTDGAEYGSAVINVMSNGATTNMAEFSADTGIIFTDPLGFPTFNIDTDGGGLVVNNADDGIGGTSVFMQSDSATPLAGDTVGSFSFVGRDSGGNQAQYGSFSNRIVDPTNTTESGHMIFQVISAGSLLDVAAFGPGAQVRPVTSDGAALGSVSFQWSDLFLFEGGVINWDNSDVTITQTGNALAIAGNTSLTSAGVAVETAGTQMIYVPAAAMISRATSGADCSKTFDSGAADNTIRVCGFDTGADEWAHFTISMPPRWNEGTITAQYVWTTGGASTPGETVSIDISCVAISDDDGLNSALGTPINVDDTMLSADLDLMTSAVSAAVTCAGTPAANDTVQFGVMRDISDDNVAADMDLIGVRLFITTDTANDG
jgi:hypothetical protein